MCIFLSSLRNRIWAVIKTCQGSIAGIWLVSVYRDARWRDVFIPTGTVHELLCCSRSSSMIQYIKFSEIKQSSFICNNRAMKLGGFEIRAH